MSFGESRDGTSSINAAGHGNMADIPPHFAASIRNNDEISSPFCSRDEEDELELATCQSQTTCAAPVAALARSAHIQPATNMNAGKPPEKKAGNWPPQRRDVQSDSTHSLGSQRRPDCPNCAFCQQTLSERWLKCQSCQVTFYCSEQHQQFDRKRHKIRCQSLQSASHRRNSMPQPGALDTAKLQTPVSESSLSSHDSAQSTSTGISSAFVRFNMNYGRQSSSDLSSGFQSLASLDSDNSSSFGRLAGHATSAAMLIEQPRAGLPRVPESHSPTGSNDDDVARSSHSSGIVIDLDQPSVSSGPPSRSAYPTAHDVEGMSPVAQLLAAQHLHLLQPQQPLMLCAPYGGLQSSSAWSSAATSTATLRSLAASHEQLAATGQQSLQQTGLASSSIADVPRSHPLYTIKSTGSLPQLSRPSASVSSHAHKFDHSVNRPFSLSAEEHLRQIALAGKAASQKHAVTQRMQEMSTHVVSSLSTFGWAIVDNFLGAAHANAVLNDVTALYKLGLFRDGQLMASAENSCRPAEPDAAGTSSSSAGPSSQSDFQTKWARSDEIFWFDNRERSTESYVGVRLVISIMDSVAAHMADRISPYHIGGRSKAMIACYPGSGTRYVKHVDNAERDGRCVTAIYYMNHDWQPDHGGTLRMYPRSALAPVDVQPNFDRLLLFLSDERNPHEVLPTYHHRFALTIWYFDRAEKSRVMARYAAAKSASSGLLSAQAAAGGRSGTSS